MMITNIKKLTNVNAQLILHVNIALKKARYMIYVKVAILKKVIILKMMIKIIIAYSLIVIMKKLYSVLLIII